MQSAIFFCRGKGNERSERTGGRVGLHALMSMAVGLVLPLSDLGLAGDASCATGKVRRI